MHPLENDECHSLQKENTHVPTDKHDVNNLEAFTNVPKPPE